MQYRLLTDAPYFNSYESGPPDTERERYDIPEKYLKSAFTIVM